MTPFETTLAHGVNAPYNHTVKAKWLSGGTAVLRRLAKDLALPKGTYTIRQCKGGIAVSGECILHHDRLYVCLAPMLYGDSGYARTCTSQKDYTGGVNRAIPKDYDGLVNLCVSILRSGC